MAYAVQANPGNTFGYGFSVFNCDTEINGQFPVQPLAYSTTSYVQGTSHTCFSVSYTVTPSDEAILEGCNALFQVGLNSYLDVGALVKFTWQFSVYRPAT
jgi:hypothetical protein